MKDNFLGMQNSISSERRSLKMHRVIQAFKTHKGILWAFFFNFKQLSLGAVEGTHAECDYFSWRGDERSVGAGV